MSAVSETSRTGCGFIQKSRVIYSLSYIWGLESASISNGEEDLRRDFQRAFDNALVTRPPDAITTKNASFNCLCWELDDPAHQLAVVQAMGAADVEPDGPFGEDFGFLRRPLKQRHPTTMIS